ncbi:MAG: tryptophan--tRNA ligase [Aggregatilineales bacterium]
MSVQPVATRKRVLSGIQPSGALTIGNYLGALKQWARVQADYDCFFCVVDLHALTMPQDPVALRESTRRNAALYIACGIDPDRSTIFLQSHVPAHTELAWVLACLTSMGALNRMTQFKDKTAKQEPGSILTGLFIYPTLMAADILLYQANAVPVGDDQKQHIELTRDLAQRFNFQYGETFTLPEPMIPLSGARIMGLDDPLHKMSKSEGTEFHSIRLLDPPNVVKKKIMRAVTDSGSQITFNDEPARAGVNNLLVIYEGFTDESRESIERRFAGHGYGDLKKAVVEAVNEGLKPIQARYDELMREGGFIDEVLARGAAQAAGVANATMRLVRDRVGLLPPVAKD